MKPVETARNQNVTALKCHATPGPVEGEDTASSCIGPEAAGHPEISGEPGEECIILNQEIGIPGIPYRLSQYGYV